MREGARRVIITVSALVLIGITVFCISGTVHSSEKVERRERENYYREIEAEYVKEVRFFLNEEGYSNSGITMTKVIDEEENRSYANELDVQFIDKNSKKMDVDLREAVSASFGFGDFIFLNPQTMEEVVRVHNLKELQNVIYSIPADSLLYHITRNHVSRWLYSRAIFPVAEFLKQVTWESLQDIDAHRKIIFEAIVKYRKMKNQGVVAVFQRDRFDRYSNFARIGDGSLGGKGRGLAFIDNMVKRHAEFEEFENATVVIPKTVVLCTDIFDEFMDMNNLYQLALSDADDETILRAFLRAKLPDRLVEDFFAFFEVVKAPIAIRSSSLLEDSHYQPFAGIYSTYMIPYLEDKYEMLRMLSDAIKGVYASVYYKDSKAYMQATRNVIDQEKMAVILQEVVGTQYGSRYYPSISGVARSINYYPINDEQAEEGTVSLALGLGKYIVDGGLTLRVCPYHPDKVLQTSEMEMALRETQTRFYALDLENTGKYKGTEVAQLYIQDKIGSVTRPVKELKRFTRVTLKPGEKKSVSFELPVSELAFWNIDMAKVVEPGDFGLWVATDSQSGEEVFFKVVD